MKATAIAFLLLVATNCFTIGLWQGAKKNAQRWESEASELAQLATRAQKTATESQEIAKEAIHQVEMMKQILTNFGVKGIK